jgi:transcriptional regulator with PAS, ATPase and Fis domain
MNHEWMKEFPGAITVCNEKGVMLEMNDRAIESFKDDGGAALIGKNVLDCHPEPAREKLRQLLQEKSANIYTIEKKGVKKIIYQSPWYKNGAFAGLVEFSLVIPNEMPHFVRK